MEGVPRVSDRGNMGGEQREPRVGYKEKMWGVSYGKEHRG